MLAKINGKNIYYEIYGSGEPLIFIHGLGATNQMWKWQIEDLQKDYQVIVYDLPGHGDSENLIAADAYRGLADDLNALMTHLSLTKAHICGLSLGGRVGLALAVYYPERINKLIISSTFERIKGFTEHLRTWLGIRLLTSWPMERIVETSAKGFFPQPAQKAAYDLYYKEANRCTKDAIIRLSRAAREEDFSKNLKNLQLPVLIFVGAKEGLMIKIAQRMANLIKNSELQIIPNAGHIWNMENPALFNTKIRDFLQK